MFTLAECSKKFGFSYRVLHWHLDKRPNHIEKAVVLQILVFMWKWQKKQDEYLKCLVDEGYSWQVRIMADAGQVRKCRGSYEMRNTKEKGFSILFSILGCLCIFQN